MRIIHGDCREVLAGLDAGSVDAVVTDPPYELGFMGKAWDASGVAFQVATWEAVLRVLKPGGHLLAFGGTRTYHRMTCAIEDAGFDVRDCLQWIYGSGFPKSLDVSKAIDKAAGAERAVVGRYELPDVSDGRRGKGWECTNTTDAGMFGVSGQSLVTAPATSSAQQWQGWGTALKPAYEPIVLARKPLIGTVAANVQQHGTGAINVDGCRVALTQYDHEEYIPNRVGYKDGIEHVQKGRSGAGFIGQPHDSQVIKPNGRWPANILHDGSEDVLALFPQTTSGALNQASVTASNRIYGQHSGYPDPNVYQPNTGSAARFFYCAKASRSERGDGNTHPTVKPLALMRYLVRLIAPPNGLVLDPFTGSGTTGIAAIREGMRFLGIEQSAEYAELAERRIREATTLPIESIA
jgi:hypothetical protein